jgi:transposase
MAERLEQHYRRLLGLEEPWVVEAVGLDLAAQRVEICLGAQVDTRGLKCPECGKWAAFYDHAPERRWRHLDTMQFETVLVARTPRVNCPWSRQCRTMGNFSPFFAHCSPIFPLSRHVQEVYVTSP